MRWSLLNLLYLGHLVTGLPADTDVVDLRRASKDAPTSATFSLLGALEDYLYIPVTPSKPETVLAWTRDGNLWVNRDQGPDWTLQGIPGEVQWVFMSDTDAHQIYLYTSTSARDATVYASFDQATNFEAITLPSAPPGVLGYVAPFLTFHPRKEDLIIFNGQDEDSTECDKLLGCPPRSYLSRDRGKTWNKFFDGSCNWVTGLQGQDDAQDELVHCQKPQMGDPDAEGPGAMGAGELYWSRNYFDSQLTTNLLLKNVINEFRVSNFMLAVTVTADGSSAELKVSRDGLTYQAISLPQDMDTKNAGTQLLTFDEKSLWMFQPRSLKYRELFGTVLRSDASGLEFIKVLENVNRASGSLSGAVDFDRLESIEGVALSNVVSNVDDVLAGAKKRIQTLITHSEGAFWSPLSFGQGQPLHLHGYTERIDVRNKIGSPTGVGVLIGRGNTGDFLESFESSQTYLSRDAGLSWQLASPRPTLWEFGNYGSLIVLADAIEATNYVNYTVDDGISWHQFEFAKPENKLRVEKIASIPSDASLKFMLFASPLGKNRNYETQAIQLDFTPIFRKRACKSDDMEWWSPDHPQLNSKCFLGHEIEYRRKKAGRICSVPQQFDNGRGSPTSQRRVKNCKCTEFDYECDIDFQRNSDGNCIPTHNSPERTKELQCAKGGIAWRQYTGYRKIAGSTCEGGLVRETAKLFACPGKEAEFAEQYGPGAGSGSGSGSGSDGPKNGGGNDDSGVDEKPKKRGFIMRVIMFCVSVSFITLIIVLGFIAYTRYAHSSSITLSGMDSAQFGMQNGADLARKAVSQVAGLWQVLRANIPLFGSRIPQDHMGFYSRMEDDERYQGLDSDGFEDDESADESVPFFRESSDPIDEDLELPSEHGASDDLPRE